MSNAKCLENTGKSVKLNQVWRKNVGGEENSKESLGDAKNLNVGDVELSVVNMSITIRLGARLIRNTTKFANLKKEENYFAGGKLD